MRLFRALAIFAVFAALCGCPDPGTDPGDIDDGDDEIVVSTDIVGPVTWAAENRYHVIEGVGVSGSLTIEAGTVVVFDGFCGFTMNTGSTLTALGTTDAHITFTSAGDQAAGGWGGVALASGSTAALAYCDFTYAGGGFGPALRIEGSATVAFCSFHDNLDSGIHAGSASGAATTITSSTFYSNGDAPMIVNYNCVADSTNSFHMGGSATSIALNCVVFSGDVEGPVVFNITEVPYFIPVDVTVWGGCSLTVSPGVVVKFNDDGTGITLNSGSLITAAGAVGNPVTFTSWSNDAVSGDTNDDGGASTTIWGAFHVSSGGALSLSRCVLSMAGGGVAFAVENAGMATVSNCSFVDNFAGAVRAWAGSSGSLTDCTASDNGADGITSFDYYIPTDSTMTSSGNTGYFTDGT